MATEAQREAASSRRVGFWLSRLGYVVMLAPLAGCVVVTVRGSGGPSSMALLIAVIGLWVGSGGIAYGDKLRGELEPREAIRVRRGLLGLPFCVALVSFGPALEDFGIWWVFLLPHLTYGIVAGAGVPHWPALAVTVVLAVPELFLTAAATQFLVVAPAQKVFGRQSPVVDTVRGLVGGVDVTEDKRSGRHKWNMWVGEPLTS
jgi:hypothetical protein